MLMKNLLRFNVTLASIFLAACVTINVYFPAAAAERAADQIIDSVTRGASGSRSTTPPPAPEPPTSSLRGAETDTQLALPEWRLVAARLLDVVVPRAYAQGSANIDVSTPEIRAITAAMQARFGELERFFAAGVVGLTVDGLVEVRDANAAGLADRARVRQLVAEDNRDRNALYAEIARANERPEWEADIRRIFAKRWVERGAKPGWYYQDASGNWNQR